MAPVDHYNPRKRKFIQGWGASVPRVVRKYAAPVSGAVLGYAHGNVPGAVAGYEFGKRFSSLSQTKQMQNNPFVTPSSRHRTRLFGSSRSRVGSSRRRPARIVGRARRGAKARRRATKPTARQPGVVVRGKKKIDRKRKAPKISPKFRKAVKRVLDVGTYTGSFDWVESGSFTYTSSNQWQQTASLWYNRGGDFFTPLDFLNAASMMWNLKGAVKGYAYGDANLLVNASNGNVKFNIVKSWVKISMVNSSHRTYYLRLYEGSPKKSGLVDTTVTSTMLSDLATDNVVTEGNGILSGYVDGSLVTAASSEVMLNGSLSNPNQLKNFASKWNIKKNLVQLEPGQSFDWHVPGPSGYNYDDAKTFDGATKQTFQKYSRSLAIAYSADLVTTTAGTVGRWPETTSAEHGIIFETRFGCILGMPKNTGWQTVGAYPAAGTPVVLGLARDRVVNVQWNATKSGTIVRVDEINPISDETTG